MEKRALKWFGKEYSWDELPSRIPAAPADRLSALLPGPLRDGSRDWLAVYRDVARAEGRGVAVLKFLEWQVEFGGSSTANIVVPKLLYAREDDVGRRLAPQRIEQVVLNDPEDAARIARMHVQKQGNFATGLYDSVISTTDVPHWRSQREHLVTAFLPDASLSQIFPVSLARARACTERLQSVSDGCRTSVDMFDFFLHETQAQLQLALFGEDDAFMERTNDAFRRSMGGKADARYVREFTSELSARWPREQNTPPAPHEDVEAGKCPVPHGPLSNRLASLGTELGGKGSAATVSAWLRCLS